MDFNATDGVEGASSSRHDEDRRRETGVTSRVERDLESTGHTGVVRLMFMPYAGMVATRGGAHDEEGR